MSQVINVRLPDDIVDKLQRWADDERRSRNNLINKIVTEAVEMHEGERDADSDDSG